MKQDNQDTGRKVVPLHTGRIAIGSAYIPKQRPTDAQWISRHVAQPKPGSGWKFLALALAALLCVVVITGAGRV